MTNEDALKKYDVKKYRTPDGYTSDIAIFTIMTKEAEPYKKPVMELKLMLIKRAATNAEGHPNIEGDKWALPGGFVQANETALQAAKRELEEETGVQGVHVKHFGVYDRPGRDPRGWIITNAHYAIVPERHLMHRQANDDASEVELFTLEEINNLALAFDHEEIIKHAVQAITADLLQTTAAKNFLPPTFTYSELQAVLRTVTNDPVITSDPAFSRKIKSLPFIEKLDGQTTTRTSKQPTQLFRFVEMEDIIKPIYSVKY
ncbi:NUDIX hydrolase [Priestia koreensis]|uniref:NUDIX hydrolase n=1 Tax=Priestia koreensis TaxID=284581 RepID=UPI0030169330